MVNRACRCTCSWSARAAGVTVPTFVSPCGTRSYDHEAHRIVSAAHVPQPVECENAHVLHERARSDLMHECNASSLSSSATVVFSVGAGQYMVNLPRVRGWRGADAHTNPPSPPHSTRHPDPPENRLPPR